MKKIFNFFSREEIYSHPIQTEWVNEFIVYRAKRNLLGLWNVHACFFNAANNAVSVADPTNIQKLVFEGRDMYCVVRISGKPDLASVTKKRATDYIKEREEHARKDVAQKNFIAERKKYIP